jgi:hypothetical protein
VGIEVGQNSGCRREDQLDPRVEHVARSAEFVEVRSAERDAHEVRRDSIDRAHGSPGEDV